MGKQEKDQRQTQEKKRKQKSGSLMLTVTVLCMLALTIGGGLFVQHEMGRYEQGILDVCATQQDAYVQLVLDQINLKENRNDADIIEDILGTLDASSNKYWTFAKDQEFLFVKDVLETNKYKNFTMDTFYSSESAKGFYEGLMVDRVIHDEIYIRDKSYIASGVMFTYGDSQYRLCLLTNSSVLLDNNKFLGAKTELTMVIVLLLFLLIIIPIGFALKQRSLLIQMGQKEEEVRKLNLEVQKLNERLSRRDLHDTRSNLWKQEMLPGFIKKLQEREISPVTVVYLECDSLDIRDQFLKKASGYLSKEVLRFAYNDTDLVLLFVQIAKTDALETLKPILPEGVKIKALDGKKERMKDGN